MAEKFDVGSGLSKLFYQTDSAQTGTKGTYSDLTAQTDLYLKAIAGKLPESDFHDTNTYQASKKEIGINNQTTEKDFFTTEATYTNELQADGSAILNVDNTQVGNQTVAQVLDYKVYDEYYKRGK